MILLRLLAALLVVAATSAAPADLPSELDFIRANITALWNEISQLREEVNHHLHEGQELDSSHDLDQVLKEVATLSHEHHVHHLHHPHEGHGEHHDGEMLQHLETSHGHDLHEHADDGSHGEGHDHAADHSHHGHRGHDDDDDDDADDDDSDEDHGSSRGGSPGHHLQDNCGGRGRTGGRGSVPSNCGGSRRPVGGHGHGSGHRHHGHSHHEHGPDHEHGDSHEDDGSHDDHDHEVKDTHDIHGLELETDGHVSQDAQFYPKDHYERDRDAASRGHSGRGFVDSWVHAYCELEPSTDLPESHVRGRVDISQRSDKTHGVYFDVDISGFDLAKGGRVYGVHVHENAVSGHSCNTAGEFNRPSVAALQYPDLFGKEHAGNIGDLTVDEEGELDHVISVSLDVTFDEMTGKSIVVHSLGLGDASSSLYEDRLACCNIVLSPSPRILHP